MKITEQQQREITAHAKERASAKHKPYSEFFHFCMATAGIDIFYCKNKKDKWEVFGSYGIEKAHQLYEHPNFQLFDRENGHRLK